MNHHKCYDKADSFIYLGFCTSVTTKINTTGHAKNTTDCGKYNSETKYYTPTENLAFEILVLCKGRVIFKQYVIKKH
jgi:hypothetical protein